MKIPEFKKRQTNKKNKAKPKKEAFFFFLTVCRFRQTSNWRKILSDTPTMRKKQQKSEKSERIVKNSNTNMKKAQKFTNSSAKRIESFKL